ncbi:MAG TPA: DUF1761 domain-containing protein [Candidatus Saccharibacteria bacterium]|mgnify:CR=1 FL=1|jgi:hypothetical protein|nr:DUF1761 domain-containing protein [Candidatus Saccharibacteria bacterium]
MDVEINFWAVIAATFVSFVVGFIWYLPQVFGERWRKLVGMDKKTWEKGPGSRGWAQTVVGAFLQAYALAHVTYLSYVFFNGATFFNSALTTAGWMWLGFQLSLFLTHDSFEHKTSQLTAIKAGSQFLTLMGMGLVIGLIGL